MNSQQRRDYFLSIASFLLLCAALGGILASEFSYVTVVIAIAWLVVSINAFRRIRAIQKELSK